MFDVVNERNEVIGQKPRGEVHAQGLMPPAPFMSSSLTSMVRVYLQLRSHLKDVHPLTWDSSAAGHLDVGESYATCALREVQEELGIEVESTEKAADIPATEHTGMEFVELHTAQRNGPMKYAPTRSPAASGSSPRSSPTGSKPDRKTLPVGFIECWKAWLARS